MKPSTPHAPPSPPPVAAPDRSFRVAASARLVGYSAASLAAADVAAFEAATADALGVNAADVLVTTAADADGAMPPPPASSRRQLRAAASAVVLSYEVTLASAAAARSAAASLAAGGGATLASLRGAGLTRLTAVDAPSTPLLLLPAPPSPPPSPPPPPPRPPPRVAPAWPPAPPPAQAGGKLRLGAMASAALAAGATGALLLAFCSVVACRVRGAREHEREFKATAAARERSRGASTERRGASRRVADVSAVLLVPPAAVLAPHDAEPDAHRTRDASRAASAAPGRDAADEVVPPDNQPAAAPHPQQREPSLPLRPPLRPPSPASPPTRQRAKSPGLGRWLQNPIFWLMQGGDTPSGDIEAQGGDGERRGSSPRRGWSRGASRRGTQEAAEAAEAEAGPIPVFQPPRATAQATLMSRTRREQLLAELGVPPM